MALGGATEKLQKVADMGDELYGKINELRDQILEMRTTVRDTHHRIEKLENTVDQQSALLEALADREGIDVDAVLTEVAIDEAESDTVDETSTVGDGGDDGSAHRDTVSAHQDARSEHGTDGPARSDDGSVDGGIPDDEGNANEE